MNETITILSKENKSLRRKLFLNGLELPEDSRKALSHSPSRYLVSQGSQQEGTLFSYSTDATPKSSRPQTVSSRPMTRESVVKGASLRGSRLPSIPSPSTKSVAFAEGAINLQSSLIVGDYQNRPQTAPETNQIKQWPSTASKKE